MRHLTVTFSLPALSLLGMLFYGVLVTVLFSGIFYPGTLSAAEQTAGSTLTSNTESSASQTSSRETLTGETLTGETLTGETSNKELANQEFWEYTFRPGDSIWKIAEKYTTSVSNWVEIQRLNKIYHGPDRRILPGTRIIVPVSMLKQQPVPAVVIAVSGDVELIRSGSEKAAEEKPNTSGEAGVSTQANKKEFAVVGTKLYSGDAVVTSAAQNLRIQFADKSELQVLPDSIVVLDKLSHHKSTGMVDTHIRLNSGSVRTWVEQLKPGSNYEIKTPAAVTAVRGTAYRVASTGDQTRTEVTEGNVGVAAGGTEKNVAEGFGLVAEKDKPLPEPVQLLPAPVPGDNASADKSVLILSWPPLDGASYYRFQVSGDEQFNSIVTQGRSETSSIELSDLPPGNYHIMVRGVDRFELEGLDAYKRFVIEEKQAIVEDPPESDNSWIIPVSVGVMILLL